MSEYRTKLRTKRLVIASAADGGTGLWIGTTQVISDAGDWIVGIAGTDMTLSGDTTIGDASADTCTINATTTVNAPITVGVDDTGHDVKFFGATSGAFLLWDESDNALEFVGAASLEMGTTGTPLVVTEGVPLIDVFTTSASTSGGTSVQSFMVKTVMTGAAGVGGRGLFHMTTNVALGGWSNALKGLVEYGATGKTAGLGSAVLAEISLSAGTTDGTYAPLESELVLGSGALTGTSTSFLYCNISGADAATFDTNGFLFEIGAGITQASGKFFDSTVNTAGPQIDHTLKVKVAGATMYIPLMDNADGS